MARDLSGDAAIRVQGVLPALYVAAVVVVVAQRDEIVDVGGSAAFPVVDVVKLAHGDGGGAIGDCAGGVERLNGTVLSRGGKSLSTADVEGDPVF